MPVEFSQFPANWRAPLYWVEIDPSMAGLARPQQNALLIGQMFTAAKGTSNKGTALPNNPIAVGSIQASGTLFGVGSMLDRMFNIFVANNAAQPIWCLPLAETGTAATGKITVSTPPTQAGVLSLMVAGQEVPVTVGQTDTVGIVAANIVAAINAMPTLPVTAVLKASGQGEVDLTCKWLGLTGNDVTYCDTYYGGLGGQVLPVGLTLTYTTATTFGGTLTGGAGSPTLTAAIAIMGDLPFEYVAFPFLDQPSLIAIQTEFGFTSSGRWGWLRELFGQLYSARRGNPGANNDFGYADLINWGLTQNAPQTSVMGFEATTMSPMWECAAAYCAEAAMGFTADPARPLQTLELLSVVPPPPHQRFTMTECNTLLGDGIAAQRVTPNGYPAILREATTYQFNIYGQPDEAYTDMTTLAILSALIRHQKQAITDKYPRMKLADDGTLFGPGQKIVTPKIIKAELVSEYMVDEFNGLVEDAAVFATNLIVERDSINPNRVNVLYPPNLIGQLRIFAVLAQFRLLGAQQTSFPQS